ncbi:MAG: entericidin EcnAB [Hoeflea sp.]|nr:entericidin EcnAB [Hoeflea sp.]MBU4531051.1 entericidin EcnAB [Alphaproteobacteria bacterium]MBU4542826.1 entericidin EcnAB [Alphaproteobacteria bacterium]MBU4552638.1 entericidin EcnAB [Alphaproteobacteria bacterium]MBV1722943.1 entericidin EcnAB [Hoeflea sp.]MBV1762854.1 entericidin EcnAB [Hoeflea sp.]
MTLTKISTVMLVALMLASCANTIRGVGRDVNQSADAVQDSF